MQSAADCPEVCRALRQIQEQASLVLDEQADRTTHDRMLLVVALSRYCLRSLQMPVRA